MLAYKTDVRSMMLHCLHRKASEGPQPDQAPAQADPVEPKAEYTFGQLTFDQGTAYHLSFEINCEGFRLFLSNGLGKVENSTAHPKWKDCNLNPLPASISHLHLNSRVSAIKPQQYLAAKAWTKT